ncbi:nucleotidyl transferase AbiEii/AbiGii toxin family protein [Candidatus Glomeribacter gigasporarum]|uniref:nucleotidyl transferase AbiEii/AbiGii toxin family protein n=1 Tax=Candidatus Glomeribacter gigasporarum TaxID=132144 RepID=UPI0019392B21|nr:nucleotidyl transferase AbiEii/AbiGii toxin family protein [Candidatus Glomeribacter gigasporarum]
MFNRPHHQRIAKLLHAFNRPLLQEARCFFGGGTAIVLLLGEYRESLDIDFLYSSREGYRLLRNIVTQQGLGDLLWEPVLHRREVRADRDAIRTILEIDQQPIKVEFFSESHLDIQGRLHPILGVPILSKEDMYATK